MNTKDLYPYSIKDLAARLGCSEASVYTYLKKIDVTQFEETYIGSTRHYQKEVLERLKSAGCGSRHRSSPGTALPSRARFFVTPLGETVVEDNIPLPTQSGMELYPFHALQPGQSFAIPNCTKNSLEKQMTEANRKFAPAKFTKRFNKDTGTMRVWRIE